MNLRQAKKIFRAHRDPRRFCPAVQKIRLVHLRRRSRLFRFPPMPVDSFDHKFVVEGGRVRPARDFWDAALFMEGGGRQVAETFVGEACVSTVFLSIDHGYHVVDRSPPVLWETMIFSFNSLPDLHDSQWRYSSRAEALEGHEAAVALVRAALERLS